MRHKKSNASSTRRFGRQHRESESLSKRATGSGYARLVEHHAPPPRVFLWTIVSADISFYRKYHFAAAHFSFPGELITCDSTITKPLTRVSAGDDAHSCARSDYLQILSSKTTSSSVADAAASFGSFGAVANKLPSIVAGHRYSRCMPSPTRGQLRAGIG